MKIQFRAKRRNLIVLALALASISPGSAIKSGEGTVTFAEALSPSEMFLQQAKLLADDGSADDEFGTSVAISGDTAVVGAWRDDVGANVDQGAAYVFIRSGSSWTFQQKLTGSDSGAGDLFGNSVSIQGDTIAVGARVADVGAVTNQGEAYVYVRNGSVWSEQQRLFDPSGAANDVFGADVEISGESLLIGVSGGDLSGVSTGLAHVYTRTGATWTLQQTVSASDGVNGGQFGAGVDLDGNTAVVGAILATGGGAAYVFVRSGTSWTQQQRLSGSDVVMGDTFGFGVAVFGDTVIAGAPQKSRNADNLRQGAAYVFTRNSDVWTQQQKLEGCAAAISDAFGGAIALQGDVAVVGRTSPAVIPPGVAPGSAYIFERSGATWTLRERLHSSTGEARFYGYGVAMDGDTVIAGSRRDAGTGSTLQGSAYVYVGGVGTPGPTCPAPMPSPTPLTPTTNCAWNTAPAYPIPIMSAAMVSFNGSIYSFGGLSNAVETTNSYRFDGTSWTPIAPLPQAMHRHAAVTDGQNIYILGGVRLELLITTLHRYDVATNTYTQLASFPTSGFAYPVVYLNGTIVKLGGQGNNSTDRYDEYNIATNTWIQRTGSPNRGYHSAVTDGTYIYTAGGTSGSSLVPSAVASRGWFAAATWNDGAFADLPQTRWGSAHGRYFGYLAMAGGFVNGGEVDANISRTVLFGDPYANIWTAMPDMPAARAFSAGVVHGDSFYVIGGKQAGSFNGTSDNQKLTCEAVAAETDHDFDGDGRADLSVFRPTAAEWYINPSTTSQAYGVQFGASADKLAVADYDGDGKADIAVWRDEPADPDRANFYILQSSDNSVRYEQFGRTGDDPSIVGDWDGDGKDDPAVYRDGGSGQSFFFYRPSSQPGVDFTTIHWGLGGDRPLRGDFDGDGNLDAAVFRGSDSVTYIRQSSTGEPRYEKWGVATDRFIPNDYDGDGTTDLAVYRDGIWYILQSTNGHLRYERFGIASDVPVPADYDGDGSADVGVFRNGTWYLNQSTGGFTAFDFGVATDKPIPNPDN